MSLSSILRRIAECVWSFAQCPCASERDFDLVALDARLLNSASPVSLLRGPTPPRIPTPAEFARPARTSQRIAHLPTLPPHPAVFSTFHATQTTAREGQPIIVTLTVYNRSHSFIHILRKTSFFAGEWLVNYLDVTDGLKTATCLTGLGDSILTNSPKDYMTIPPGGKASASLDVRPAYYYGDGYRQFPDGELPVGNWTMQYAEPIMFTIQPIKTITADTRILVGSHVIGRPTVNVIEARPWW
jgi:hypothetical protein